MLEELPGEEPIVSGEVSEGAISPHQPTDQLKMRNAKCLIDAYLGDKHCYSQRSLRFSGGINYRSLYAHALSAFPVQAAEHHRDPRQWNQPWLHAWRKVARKHKAKDAGRSPARGTASQVGQRQRSWGQRQGQEWLRCRGVVRGAAPGTAPEVR